jgi:hypothetical protein
MPFSMSWLDSEKPRERRCPFVALIELTNVESDVHVTANTTNLSFSGCGVEKQVTLPIGAKVMVRIVHRGEKFTAYGQVARVQIDGEIGIIFTRIEPADRATLDKWLVEFRKDG